ncbi:MAG: hypothetical protein C5B51_22920 [Terriglobia bacterium]|nr:MAG: hypothetical protein C5B51_22920 [Terriglobia bacterium]
MSELSVRLPAVAGINPDITSRTGQTPAKVTDAAQQFEALLMAQILRSERESGNGWLGGEGDSASSCASDFAEQQLSVLLAQRGGLGLASLIASGLKTKAGL